MQFLDARWSNLVLVNYAVDPGFLAPFCPRGVVPDTLDGMGYVSLVAFDFQETRVLGVSWPGYRSFPEINLRFYVREGDRRGVCFVAELVPRRLVAWIARLAYNEPYRHAPMQSRVCRDDGRIRVSHRVLVRSGICRIDVEADDRPQMPGVGSREHFFKEHQWGYGTDRFGRTLRYEVRHPRWCVCPVRRFRLRWDWAGVYGKPWDFLHHASPDSVCLAKGSRIEVRSPAIVE